MAKEKEREVRFNELLTFDLAFRKKGFKAIAGVDEVGRGPLAGPVVAVACILPSRTKAKFAGIDDSKKLTAEEREEIFEALISDRGVHYGIGTVSSQDIDKYNIYHASLRAMVQAAIALPVDPDLFLVDGNARPKVDSKYTLETVVGGDAKSLSIAAASIIAKVTRDRIMLKFHNAFPEYGFERNKGYSTPEHLSALKIHGPSPIHRYSFMPVRESESKILSLLT